MKKLPIVMPPIETYQGCSFILGIILANDNVKSSYYNKYINVSCYDTDSTFQMELKFTNDLWEDYRTAGIAEMDMYYLRNIAKEKFIDFIKERIDQENYVLLHYIDEYFLSYSFNYKKEHVIHDSYIYGYNENSFLVMVYKDNKLRLCEVLKQEIVDGMYSYLERDNNTHFCTFRICHNAVIKENANEMLQELINYVTGYEALDSNCVYGIKIYKVLLKCINEIAKGAGKDGDKLDLRTFRMLWEHKKVLLGHLQKLMELKGYSNCSLQNMVEVEVLANRVFMLAIKYDITCDKRIITAILNGAQEMEKKEKEFLSNLLYGLRKNY